jgi:glycosyltransferase involved in cell wall biosynthesis
MPANHRPRVLLLIPHLGGGGAERVTALLARGLSKEKYQLHLDLVTQSEPGSDFAAEGVDIHALGARRVRSGALGLLRLARRLKPDLILSGMAHLNFMVLLLRPLLPRATRILVRQNSTASAALDFGGLPAYTRLFYRLLYRRADRVICQSAAMARDLSSEIGVPAARLAVLPNPIDVEGIRARTNASQPPRAATDSSARKSGIRSPRLLAVGRLSREKGFDLLIDALSRVREHFPGTHLTIAGTGPEGATLKAEASSLDLQSAVHFAGYVEDLSPFLTQASLFVLSSRYEGMPNALLEAAAAGLPIVAVPSSEGVVDLLRGQPGVWLAKAISADALAEALLAALETIRPGERFAHEFIEPFRLDRAIAAYETLIDEVLREAQA